LFFCVLLRSQASVQNLKKEYPVDIGNTVECCDYVVLSFWSVCFMTFVCIVQNCQSNCIFFVCKLPAPVLAVPPKRHICHVLHHYNGS